MQRQKSLLSQNAICSIKPLFPLLFIALFSKVAFAGARQANGKDFAGNRTDDFASRKLLTQQHLFVNPGVNLTVFGWTKKYSLQFTS